VGVTKISASLSAALAASGALAVIDNVSAAKIRFKCMADNRFGAR
jgi:hypothetical protein